MQTMETMNVPVDRPAFLRDRRDRIMVVLALALGVLFCELVFFAGFGIGMTLWLALLYGAALWFLRGNAARDRLGWALLVPIAALGVSYALYDDTALQLLDFVVLLALCALQLAQWTGMRAQEFTAAGLAADVFHTSFLLPLTNLLSPFRVLAGGSKGGKRSKGWVQVLLGMAVALPLLILVLSLLSSADAVFEKLLGNTLKYFQQNLSKSLIKLILGAILAVPLGGMLYALRRRKPVGGFDKPIDFQRAAVLDGRLTVTVLAMLSVVYVAFIAVQFGYLIGGFRSLLPQAYTYAEYARRGFFELMGVVVVNLCVYGLALALTRRPTSGAVRGMLLVLGACTLALIASALAKMIMYINAYGLTELRVYTSWFMVLCAVVFVALLLQAVTRKFPAMPVIFTAALVLFLGLNFVGVDRLVAKVNVDRYTSGAAIAVDFSAMAKLSDAMVPEVLPLLQDKDLQTAAAARKLLEERAKVLGGSWQTFTVERAYATTLLQNAGFQIGRNPRSMD